MSGIASISGVGVGLYGDYLTGSAMFIFDTKHENSYIDTINYKVNNFNPSQASFMCFCDVGDYPCNLFKVNNLPFTNGQTVGRYGRYVGIKINITRNSTAVYSPRIYEFDIDFEYEKTEYEYRHIYKLKADIFRNQYTLLKDKVELDQYNYWFLGGNILVKTLTDKTVPLQEFVPSSFTKYSYKEDEYPNLYTEMISGVRDFDVFFDTFMFITSNYVVFEKGMFNYEENSFKFVETDFHILNLSEINVNFADTWYFESKNEVLVFLLKNGSTPKLPELKVYKIVLSTGRFKEIEVRNTELLQDVESLSLNEIEKPVVTFDGLNNMFNVGMVCYNGEKEFHILSLDLEYNGEFLNITNIEAINPVDNTDSGL